MERIPSWLVGNWIWRFMPEFFEPTTELISFYLPQSFSCSDLFRHADQKFWCLCLLQERPYNMSMRWHIPGCYRPDSTGLRMHTAKIIVRSIWRMPLLPFWKQFSHIRASSVTSKNCQTCNSTVTVHHPTCTYSCWGLVLMVQRLENSVELTISRGCMQEARTFPVAA
jgi:hypothetical protein